MGWAIEATDGSGYARNALVFATEEEAKRYASDLMSRWFGCRDTRLIEVDEPVNYKFEEGADRATKLEG